MMRPGTTKREDLNLLDGYSTVPYSHPLDLNFQHFIQIIFKYGTISTTFILR